MQRISRLGAMLFLAILIASCGTSKPVGPGQYRVSKGDTLTKIARQHGQSVESLMRMNKLVNPNHLKTGQVLKVKEEASSGGTTGSGQSVLPPSKGDGKSVAAPRSIKLIWPAKGESRRGTSASNSQGVYIKAAKGTAVQAAANGKVVYAGDGLRGYGNMLIVSHDANFLTVYAHNDSLLVKEGASVKQGQKIATVGSTGTRTEQLYFELRYNGKPVDVTRHLP